MKKPDIKECMKEIYSHIQGNMYSEKDNVNIPVNKFGWPAKQKMHVGVTTRYPAASTSLL